MWQNPAAVVNTVDKVASGAATKPSRARQREEIVASYWQRYCAKNDTIGFFGPLAWGRVADDGPPLRVRSGAVVCECSVHLEAWGVQALASCLDESLAIAAGPYTERELRAWRAREAGRATGSLPHRRRSLGVRWRRSTRRSSSSPAARRPAIRPGLRRADARLLGLQRLPRASEWGDQRCAP
jgi:Lantibiotic dehydratase, N terminus